MCRKRALVAAVGGVVTAGSSPGPAHPPELYGVTSGAHAAMPIHAQEASLTLHGRKPAPCRVCAAVTSGTSPRCTNGRVSPGGWCYAQCVTVCMLPMLLRLLRCLWIAPHRSTLPSAHASGRLIFRLRRWPTITEVGRTTERYRMLSLMSLQPVNRGWMERHGRMATHELDRFIAELADCGAIEIIDPTEFAGGSPRESARPG